MKKMSRKWVLGGVAFLLCICMFGAVALSGGGKGSATPAPADAQAGIQIATPQQVAQAAESAATTAPKATNPPKPTSTPKPTQTPVPPPTARPTIAPQVIAGKGQQASSKFTLPAGLATFEMTYGGGRNFAIELLDDQANHVELLVNVIGSFQGSKAVQIPKSGQYVMDVTASAPWSVTVKQPVAGPDAKAAPLSLSGAGQQASEMFRLKKGLATFKMKYTGERNFAIVLMTERGQHVDLLVNEIGAFDGSKAVRVPADGYYLMDITASGPWTVSIE